MFVRNESVDGLLSIEVPRTAAGADLRRLVHTVTIWATSDAASAIDQVRALDRRSSDEQALRRLVRDERLLDAIVRAHRPSSLPQSGSFELAFRLFISCACRRRRHDLGGPRSRARARPRSPGRLELLHAFADHDEQDEAEQDARGDV